MEVRIWSKNYFTSSGMQIKVDFKKINTSTVEISIYNSNFEKDRRSRILHLILVVMLYTFYLNVFKNQQHLIVHLICFLLFILFVYRFFYLVKSGNYPQIIAT